MAQYKIEPSLRLYISIKNTITARINLARFTFLLQLILVMNSVASAQIKAVTLSGKAIDSASTLAVSYASVILKRGSDGTFVTGTITDETGRFSVSAPSQNTYYLEIAYVGYDTKTETMYLGGLSDNIDIGKLSLVPNLSSLTEVIVAVKKENINAAMDKKTFNLTDNISQGGGSVLQTMQNLPGVTVQDGKIQLRGNDKITVLIDGKQTALTGFGSQTGLDNIPASAIEKIEIINNPSAKYDANGNAGIINIIYKKNYQEGWNGKVGLTSGIGSLWIRKVNLPSIRPQYQYTPKVNPSVALNYRKKRINIFIQADNLYTKTLNKNEFVSRSYTDGTIINQQLKRNRNTHFFTSKAGLDFYINESNSVTFSTLFGSEQIIDRGDQPFFNADYSERKRLWQFVEDELKTTAMATTSYTHKFSEPGRLLNIGMNYTFHRENEQYTFDNTMPSFTGADAFKLLSDEQVYDWNIDYTQPLKNGKLESGAKFRKRFIPTNMQFYPGLNSPLDTNAGGWANYNELIPAIYSNYMYENKHIEAEAGLRLEYVNLKYDVNPEHNTYKSSGYDYFQPFPNLRLSYKLNDKNKLTAFYNRRVDRPNEVDIRIFPKYDDAEIIKVGNPGLRPQFTNTLELGYKTQFKKGYIYSAAYHKEANATITRIASVVPGSTLIYAIFQNAGNSTNSGIEFVYNQTVSSLYSFNLNLNGYQNQIDAFSVENLYPVKNTYTSSAQNIISGNIKLNQNFKFKNKMEAQLTAVYLAPDIIPQGKIEGRFSIDFGLKKRLQKDKGELFVNGTDIFNTLIIKKTINGDGFSYTSTDYYETQVFRLGYTYKF